MGFILMSLAGFPGSSDPGWPCAGAPGRLLCLGSASPCCHCPEDILALRSCLVQCKQRQWSQDASVVLAAGCDRLLWKLRLSPLSRQGMLFSADLVHFLLPACILSSNWAYAVRSLLLALPSSSASPALRRTCSNLPWIWFKDRWFICRTVSKGKRKESVFAEYLLCAKFWAMLSIYVSPCNAHISTKEVPCPPGCKLGTLQKLGSLLLLCKWEEGNWPTNWGRSGSNIHTFSAEIYAIESPSHAAAFCCIP